MILKSIRLRGSLGLKGLGVPEVFLDLTQLPEEGLVAICGTNGAGKTTLLDSLHGYRLQPFKCRKAKDWSPGSFSFYDQYYGNDALKELVFEMGDHEYRSLVLIDVPRRKQEAYLFRHEGDSWVPMNDGKVSTYDPAIEAVCGSPTLFFSSVFRCQGAKSLSDYTRGNILAIISELLNVDHIKEQSEKCRAVVTGLSSSLSSLRDRVSALAVEAGGATELVDSIALLETELSTNRLGLGAARNDLDEVRRTITGYREQIAAADSDAERKGLVERSLSDEQGRRLLAESEHTRIIAGLDRRAASLRTEHEGWLANHDTRSSRVELDARTDLDALSRRRSVATESHATWLSHPETGIEARITRALRITDGADKIRAQVPIEANLQARLAADKLRLPALEEAYSVAFAADAKHTQDLSVLRLRLGDCQKSAGNLNGIDCTPDESGWVKPSCRLIATAVTDRDRIVSLEDQIAKAEADISVRDALQSADADRAACRHAIAMAETDLKAAQTYTRLLPELEVAETSLAGWRQEVTDRAAQLTTELAALDQESLAREGLLANDRKMLTVLTVEHTEKYEADLAACAIERKQSEEKWLVDVSVFDARLEELQQQIAAFPPAGTDLQDLLRVATIKEGAGLTAVEEYDKRIRTIDLDIAAQRVRLLAAQQKGTERDGLQPKLDQYAALIARFSLLQRACSNDGIISLELDDASPSIAALVNDLLRACYGSRFTIRLDTQATKQDGDLKDVFDIIVFDSETGEEASITEKSGGQTTIIEDAITRGICLYNIHRSDRVYGTLYSDERDGALDADRKLEFLRVKREALRVGTHSREFFISQTPDLVEMADARIMLAPGGARIC